MEKMEVKKEVDEILEEPITEAVKVEKKAKAPKATKWIIDDSKATKTCESCGAVMRGWAFREDFKYCPICGAKAE